MPSREDVEKAYNEAIEERDKAILKAKAAKRTLDEVLIAEQKEALENPDVAVEANTVTQEGS